MKRVALIFDNTIRPDTTGVYVERALRQIADVVHFLPTQIDQIRPEYDLYLNIDDGLTYHWTREDLHPSAWWVIDTHLQFDWDRQKAVNFDCLYTAQKNGVLKFRLEEFENVKWLPLACDPEIHSRIAGQRKQFNICFVGNLFQGPRTELIELLKDEVPRVHITQAYFRDMAKTYTQSKMVFNCSVRDDVNMRVFEAISCGSLLITNAIKENGQEELFEDGKHFVTYTSPEELIEKTRYYLQHEQEREAIAQAGMEYVQEHHTYLERVKALLKDFPTVIKKDFPKTYTTQAKTAIIIVACNVLEMTKQCIDSVLQFTKTPFELIIVDNGSTDGTGDYLKTLQEKMSSVRCEVITNDSNKGYPAAVNQALQYLSDTAEFVLLLNNDTVVTHEYLNHMLRVFDRETTAGILGPGTNNCSGVQQVSTTYYADEPSMQIFAKDFHQIYDGLCVKVDRLVGFCMLIRRIVIDQIGTFDERFGIGNFEDDDFCCRAAAAGWKLFLVGDVFVHHFGQQTFQSIGIDYNRLMQENWQKYIEKYPDGGLHKEELREAQTLKRQTAVEKRFPTVTN